MWERVLFTCIESYDPSYGLGSSGGIGAIEGD